VSELAYHGGVPGLRPGDWITPRPKDDRRHLLADCPTCRARAAGAPLADDDLDPTLVYVTADRAFARIYAAGYPMGAVYRVRPDGPRVESPDPEETGSFGCPRAQVVAVLDALVVMTPGELRRALRRWGA
jgi:hypothetical protein